MKQELQKYLDLKYPNSQIDFPQSIIGKVHIRFDLGAELENGTKKRVNQAIERASILFKETFDDTQKDIWILIYEYCEDIPQSSHIDYLYGLIPQQNLDKFYNKINKIKTGFTETGANGIEIEEELEVRILIGKIDFFEIEFNKIITGIANLEMGFEPKIPQQIYFFDSSTDKGFYMYDDRGCFVWADNSEKIRNIYLKFNDWIVDYHRPEIDPYFEKK